jgi:hypothetical protein
VVVDVKLSHSSTVSTQKDDMLCDIYGLVALNREFFHISPQSFWDIFMNEETHFNVLEFRSYMYKSNIYTHIRTTCHEGRGLRMYNSLPEFDASKPSSTRGP